MDLVSRDKTKNNPKYIYLNLLPLCRLQIEQNLIFYKILHRFQLALVVFAFHTMPSTDFQASTVERSHTRTSPMKLNHIQNHSELDINIHV